MTGRLGSFLLRRALAAILLVALVSSGAFVLATLAPGDATTELALSGADPETVARMRAELGLDRPFLARLGDWAGGLLRLDLGRSSRFGGRPVAGLLAERLPNTVKLAGAALLIAVLIGLPLGVLTGARPHGALAHAVMPVSVALLACPPIVGALALLFVAATTGWLSVAPGSLAVPALALALPLGAALERLQSQATSEALTTSSLVAAAARGMPPRRLLWVHAGRQSLRPVLGVAGIVIGTLFSGSLAVEFVTAWPGLGRLTYEAVVGRDLHLVAGCALVGGILIASGNLTADLLRSLVDPRVREGT